MRICQTSLIISIKDEIDAVDKMPAKLKVCATKLQRKKGGNCLHSTFPKHKSDLLQHIKGGFLRKIVIIQQCCSSLNCSNLRIVHQDTLNNQDTFALLIPLSALPSLFSGIKESWNHSTRGQKMEVNFVYWAYLENISKRLQCLNAPLLKLGPVRFRNFHRDLFSKLS